MIAAAVAAAVTRPLEGMHAAAHQRAEHRAVQRVVVARSRIADAGDLRRRLAAVVVARVGIAQAAIAVPDRLAVGQLQAEHAVEVAPMAAADQLHALVVATAALRAAGLQAEVHPLVLLLEDDVDDAGDRVRTVNRRGAAAEDLDAVDHHARHVGEVDRVDRAVVRDRVVGDAMAVDQHQRVVGTESAQADHVGRRREGAAEILALHQAGVLRQLGQHVEHAAVAALVDVLALDDDHRRRPLDLRARNARTGDGDRLERLLGRGRLAGVLRERRRQRQGQGQGQDDRERKDATKARSYAHGVDSTATEDSGPRAVDRSARAQRSSA